MTPSPLPLDGIAVLDFTTLLPGPLATLMLAEAGAEVIKIEHPDGGDPIRRIGPFAADGTSVRFLVLNRGKRSLALDLKDPADRDRARELAAHADVVVEQFRPGVMRRLGLGYEQLSQLNPKLVYCSITGYGQTGPRSGVAGHDLNYVADAGLLSLVQDDHGHPVLPAVTYADSAGGSYPAIVNILLALTARERSGRGTHLDVAMSENLLTFAYSGVAAGSVGAWPVTSGELLTGGSPRYGLYATADGGHLAVAALEPQFWADFCEAVALPDELRDDRRDPAATRAEIARLIAARPTAQWQAAFAGRDVCVSVVRDLADAVADPQIQARGLFADRVGLPGAQQSVPVMHVPISRDLRVAPGRRDAPRLVPGEPVDWSKLTSDSTVI